MGPVRGTSIQAWTSQMTDIAIAYDRSETDELGIRLTAEEMDIDLEYLPFHKIAIAFANHGFTYKSLGRDYTKAIQDIRVILNRTQSKNRRILAAEIFETLKKKVVNPFHVELSCHSKLSVLLAFFANGIPTPKTVYVPCNVQETKVSGGVLKNNDAISRLTSLHLGNGKVVLKPDRAAHGRDVALAEGKEALREMLDDYSPSIINPSGVIAQEFIPKWFFDLRIVVEKSNGKHGLCHPTALARGGFKDFRTNTFLGNMVFRAKLPATVLKEAVKCGEALGGEAEAWVLALDAMPYIGDGRTVEDDEMKSYFDSLENSFDKVKKVKRDSLKKGDFRRYTENIEKAYAEYMSKDAYARIQEVIEEILERRQDSVLFHEGNACPEFWEQTRIVGGVNIAESLLRCGQSLLDT